MTECLGVRRGVFFISYEMAKPVVRFFILGFGVSINWRISRIRTNALTLTRVTLLDCPL